jgi:hypothetical protein
VEPGSAPIPGFEDLRRVDPRLIRDYSPVLKVPRFGQCKFVARQEVLVRRAEPRTSHPACPTRNTPCFVHLSHVYWISLGVLPQRVEVLLSFQPLSISGVGEGEYD